MWIGYERSPALDNKATRRLSILPPASRAARARAPARSAGRCRRSGGRPRGRADRARGRARAEARAGRRARAAGGFGSGARAREHDALELRELGERLCLACAEAGFALDLEDHRDLHAAARLNLVIGVDEAQLEPPGERAPDGGLAGAHQADQVEIGALHDSIVE